MNELTFEETQQVNGAGGKIDPGGYGDAVPVSPYKLGPAGYDDPIVPCGGLSGGVVGS